MKLHQLLPLSALLLLGLPAFRPASEATSLTIGKDEPRREVRDVASFTALTLSTSAEVEVRQGATQRVEVLASADDLKEVETEVKNGRLTIRTKQHSGLGWHNLGPVKVYITMPQVTALSVSGSGTMRAPDALRTDELTLSISGSGKLVAALQAQRLSSSVSGSGTIQVSGSAPRHDISLSGSGKVQAADLRTDASSVRISGSGNCYVQANQTLEAHISGSGGVRYTGAAKVSSRISGSGRVVRG